MLTVLSYIVPTLKDIRYSIMVEYCAEMAKYYCKLRDSKNALYWSALASKYVIKRIDLINKKGLLK